MATVELSRADFLNELRIAPKWKLFQHYKGGYFELLVFYSFGTWIYKSPSIFGMNEQEGKSFCRTLTEIASIPSVAEAKVE